MATPRKLIGSVEDVIPHGRRVYSVRIRTDRKLPRFRAGQFMHLALDSYDPSYGWPESRVFSIASPPSSRDSLLMVYAVKGSYTARMESELKPGRKVWIKLPFGEFTVEPAEETVLLAGGTGMAAFTAFLEDVSARRQAGLLHVVYGAADPSLLIFQHELLAGPGAEPNTKLYFFAEQPSPETDQSTGVPAFVDGMIDLSMLWPCLKTGAEAVFYISGPPGMISALRGDLLGRGVDRAHIRTDEWE